MASESTSPQQSQQLIPSSKVNFRYTDSIIGFNNVVALLEHINELYQPMLSFLSNCWINKALTLQPIAMYVEYLKEFWYIAEVEKETKTITFLLSWWDQPLSFTQDEFISALASIYHGQSLIPPFGEVNADDTADKSLSRASVQPVTQPKAPTDLKIKKKRIPPSSKPKSPYKVRVILPKKQIAETQHFEVTVATTDATKILVASELAKEQVNQPSATEAEKIMDEVDSKTQGAQENAESPFDTESKIKIIKSYQAAIISNSLFIHQSSSYDQDQNVDQIESNISKKVAEDIQSSVPTIDSIKNSVSESIIEELPQVDAQHLLKPEEQQKSFHKFTDQLFGTTSLKFSPTPPKDPVKGKEFSIVKEQVNELVTYQEEGGSIPEMPKIKSFITSEGTLTRTKEEFNQATLKAQAQKWIEHEAKKAKRWRSTNIRSPSELINCQSQRSAMLSIKIKKQP
ncbi:hypothetical protein Tco_0674537 [Tanacetum coccineum]